MEGLELEEASVEVVEGSASTLRKCLRGFEGFAKI